jgi:predicted nicotinamide N-methyase
MEASPEVRRRRLLARIERRFRTITDTHAVGPLRLAFTRVADPNAVLDQVCQEEDRREKQTGQRRNGLDLHLPYWAELWESALGIGSYLTEQKLKSPTSDRKSVLDLGCGMGFGGMVAAALGANVLFADLESDALLFARLNSLPWADQVRTHRINWREDRLDESFDLILGADVLYDRKEWEFLDRFFQAHLKSKGTILLGEPGRQTGDLFPDWIRQRGWNLDQLHQPLPGKSRPVRIFKLQKH